MLYVFLKMSFIGCVCLLFSCSNLADNDTIREQQETISVVKTRGVSMLPKGKVAARVSGNRFWFAWNSVLSDCDWGQSISLHSSYLGSIAYSGRRYPEQEINTEIEISSQYMGKEWGALSVIISACGNQIEFPLIYQGSSYSGELMVCSHNFEPRETYIVIKGSDTGVDIETDLSRAGKMEFKAVVTYPTDLHENTESKEFVKNISSGKQITHFGWYWNTSAPLYMGTLWFTVRIYDSHCENLPTDNCSNFLEKRISWSMANSYGKYDFSGYSDIIGG